MTNEAPIQDVGVITAGDEMAAAGAPLTVRGGATSISVGSDQARDAGGDAVGMDIGGTEEEESDCAHDFPTE